jgi:hypothetical protein
MDKEDAINLIRQPVVGLVSYDDSAVEELWRYTHGHPYLLQCLCFDLISDMNRRGEGNFISLGDVTNIIQRFISGRNLDALWERCTPVDKDILYALAKSRESRQIGMTQAELIEILNEHSENEIADSLPRLVKRTLLEKARRPTGEIEFTHTILLFSKWLDANAPMENKRPVKKSGAAAIGI